MAKVHVVSASPDGASIERTFEVPTGRDLRLTLHHTGAALSLEHVFSPSSSSADVPADAIVSDRIDARIEQLEQRQDRALSELRTLLAAILTAVKELRQPRSTAIFASSAAVDADGRLLRNAFLRSPDRLPGRSG